MNSEWMKVMLEEIARKKADAEQEQLELQRRSEDRGAQPPTATPPAAPAPRSENGSRAPALKPSRLC
jgi:hypothetical protein